MIIYQHPLYVFELIENNQVLLFAWSEKTSGMTQEDYQEALHNYAGFGSEYQVPAMLVDVRNFKYRMTPELGIWRDEQISPRYLKFGLHKFAYIVPEEALSKMKDTDCVPERGFEEAYFDDRDEAVKWLLT